MAASLTAPLQPPFNVGFRERRVRARDLGISPGILAPGRLNAITDVTGVAVGQSTIYKGENVRTGVTAILPHTGNVFRDKVGAAIYVGNGFGKLVGSTQIEELGVIESPIVLTNTLSVWRASEAVADYILNQHGNEDVHSVNVVVGETNDGILNDIRGMHVAKSHVMEALTRARTGPVAEGCVGAGTGTIAFGFKGGIGTASRIVPTAGQNYFVGILVQSNFGGVLTIDGLQVGKEISRHILSGDNGDGSIMIVVATDAPVDSRQLKRLAKRAMFGVSRTGSPMTHGSGDYAIAFSTASNRTPWCPQNAGAVSLADAEMTPLFQAAVEATEEAIYNSLFMASTTKGMNGKTVEAISLSVVQEIMEKYQYRLQTSRR